MVLIKGQNYDISNQQNTVLTADAHSGDTEIFVENNDGFSVDDYIVMNPFNEVTEIVKISTSTNNKITLATALLFNYAEKAKIYKTPYNQMKFYSATTSSGTYTARATTDIMYDQPFTEYEYAAGTADLYYKVTFYNETTTTETDIDSSTYFQVSVDDTYVTPREMMIYLQFANGVIEISEMKEIIKLAEMKVDLDVSSSNASVLKISSFLLSKHYILNALASKAISTGYIIATVEGRTVTKSHTELKKDAESALMEYNDFLIANARTEVSKTGFLGDISSETRQQIIDVMTGAQDGLDYEDHYLFSYGPRFRRR